MTMEKGRKQKHGKIEDITLKGIYFFNRLLKILDQGRNLTEHG